MRWSFSYTMLRAWSITQGVLTLVFGDDLARGHVAFDILRMGPELSAGRANSIHYCHTASLRGLKFKVDDEV
jgi:hypothetical protein